MTLDTSKAALFIEHSERARQLGHKARFCSRYNEGSLRLFTRQRALTPTSQPSSPPVPPSVRALSLPLSPPRNPLTPQPYPWSFSHTTPPLAINARERWARVRARALCDLRTPSFPIPSSPSPLSRLLFLFFSTQISLSLYLFLSLAICPSPLCCTDFAAGACSREALKCPETRRGSIGGARHPDPIE